MNTLSIRPFLAAALTGVAIACTGTGPAPSSTPEGSTQRSVVFLYTGDEHGWLQPDKGRGGAVALLHQWLRDEQHCIPAQNPCEQASTVAVSGGDNWTGPSISAYFQGLPMARAMRSLGYSASALGNHEVDFGQAVLARNAREQGYRFVSANVVTPDGLREAVQPWAWIERKNVRIALIGVTNEQTPNIALQANVADMRFEPVESSLQRVVPQAWQAGADVVAVLAHVCADEIVPVVQRNPDWKLAFVGAAHCHRRSTTQVGATPVIETGTGLQHYGRIEVTADLSRPKGQRVVDVTPRTVPIGEPPTAQAPQAVLEMQAHVASWQAKLDQHLGEPIGFSKTGMAKESDQMVRWILRAWRETTGARVAMINPHAMRQSVPPGALTLQHVYDVLPFNNRLVRMKLSGKALEKNATCCGAKISGLRREPSGWVLDDGTPLDPAAHYDVVVPDFIFYGGDGFSFEADATDTQMGEDRRKPLIDWMRKRNSTATDPLA